MSTILSIFYQCCYRLSINYLNTLYTNFPLNGNTIICRKNLCLCLRLHAQGPVTLYTDTCALETSSYKIDVLLPLLHDTRLKSTNKHLICKVLFMMQIILYG